MVDLGGYLLAAVQLALVVVPLAFSAYRLRAAVLAGLGGRARAPGRGDRRGRAAHLARRSSWALRALLCRGSDRRRTSSGGDDGVLAGGSCRGRGPTPLPVASFRRRGSPLPCAPAGESLVSLLVMVAVIAATVFSYAVTTKHALDRGVFNFDSLWYHLPFAVDMVQTHSVVGMHHTDTVFTNWFYPQNSELLHAVGILLTGRDTLSLFLNFGWLAVAFLAAYCVGRPYGRGASDGCGRGDPARVPHAGGARPGRGQERPGRRRPAAGLDRDPGRGLEPSRGSLVRLFRTKEPRDASGWAAGGGWAGGWAGGWDAGHGPGDGGGADASRWSCWRRRGGAGRLRGGGSCRRSRAGRSGTCATWSSPATRSPRCTRWGRSPCRTPSGCRKGGPTSTSSTTRPTPASGASTSARACTRPSGRSGRWWSSPRPPRPWSPSFAVATGSCVGSAAVALFGLLAYLFTPLSAAGAEGEPVGFGINIRYVIPALLAGIVLLPLDRAARRREAPSGGCWGRWSSSSSSPTAPTTPSTTRPGSSPSSWSSSPCCCRRCCSTCAAGARSPPRWWAPAPRCSSLLVAIGYPVQRHYLEHRFANTGSADERIPGMHLDDAYRWARGVEDARIGLAGTTAGFAGYGFYGTDLSQPRPSTSAKTAPTAPSTRSPPAPASAPRSTTPISTTWSPRPSSTSSTRATRSPRRRRAGCAARTPSARSCAAARSPSGGSRASSTPPPAAPQRAAARDPADARRLIAGAPAG